MSLRPSLVFALAFIPAVFTGCKPDAALKHPALIGDGTRNSNPGAAEPPPDPSGTASPSARPPYTGPSGAVSGTISYAGPLPSNSIDTSMDPACAMGGGSDRLPVETISAKGGHLANVFLYVKSGPPQAMQAGPSNLQPVTMDQQHCRYVPHVIAVSPGQPVEFLNSDPTMHNIHTNPTSVGNETVDISQGPRGNPVRRTFRAPEVMLPVRCNNHPWMSAFINVSPSAFFTVSDSSGHFDLRGLPPGTYTLAAVQEKLGEKDAQVTVTAGNTARLNVAF